MPKRNRKYIPKKESQIKALSIVSLIDIMTILLVFLIKNVTSEAYRSTVPAGMKVPSINRDYDPLEHDAAAIVTVFPDSILVGEQAVSYGRIDALEKDTESKSRLLIYLKNKVADVEKKNKTVADSLQVEPVMLIRADKSIPCHFISELVRLGTTVEFKSIYFANAEDSQWMSGRKQNSGG